MTADGQKRIAGQPPVPRSRRSGVAREAKLAALAGYRQLPGWLRRMLVGWTTPSFQVGATLLVRRGDGALLLVHQSYRKGWGLPGGLLKRDEHPSDAALREVSEEVGVDAELTGAPKVVFDSRYRRIDVVFPARLSRQGSQEPYPRSAEIKEVKWFAPDDLPPCLQRETVQALVEAGVLSGPAPGRGPSTGTAGAG